MNDAFLDDTRARANGLCLGWLAFIGFRKIPPDGSGVVAGCTSLVRRKKVVVESIRVLFLHFEIWQCRWGFEIDSMLEHSMYTNNNATSTVEEIESERSSAVEWVCDVDWPIA